MVTKKHDSETDYFYYFTKCAEKYPAADATCIEISEQKGINVKIYSNFINRIAEFFLLLKIVSVF